MPVFCSSLVRSLLYRLVVFVLPSVAESYMDAKFGGEGADMVEIVGGW